MEVSHMSNSISSVHNRNQPAAEEAQPPRPQPPPAQTQKSGELSQDKVTLRSAGEVNRDGGQ
jgi:hypothetical protein